MYHEQAWRVTPAHLARLAALAESFALRPGPGGSTASDRALTSERYRPELSVLLPGQWTNAMLMALWPSSQLVGHTDPPVRGTRYHMPLLTNDDCWVFHTGTWQQLVPGQVYVMDPTEIHGAVNWGQTLRVHLVVDVEGEWPSIA